MKFPYPISYEFPSPFPRNKISHWSFLFQIRFERNRNIISYARRVNSDELASLYTRKLKYRKIAMILPHFSEIRSFNVNLLRKESLYSKLRYSRTPSFDIVSGGSALLVTSFLGYVICDKCGFELIDSGDFLFLIVYLTAALFAIKTLLKLYTNTSRQWNVLNFRLWFEFYSNFVRFTSVAIVSLIIGRRK